MAVLFDLDGVFYRGEEAIPGATNVANWARDNDVPHLYLTNTTSRPRTALVEKLAGFGHDNLRLLPTDPRSRALPANTLARAMDQDAACSASPSAIKRL